MNIPTSIPRHPRGAPTHRISYGMLHRPATPAERAIFVLRPPYVQVEHHTTWQVLDAASASPGTIVGIQVERADGDGLRLQETIARIRQRSPSTPVILLLHLSMENCLVISGNASRMGARATVWAGQSMQSAVRASLTRTAGLGADVVEWAQMRGVGFSAGTAMLVERIVTLAPRFPELTGLLKEVGVAETSARFRMQKKRLPPPSRWFQAARALHAALEMQSRSEVPLLKLAHELGYSDHSALSQLVYRAFGVRPSGIRGTLGWEWLLDRWIVMHNVPRWKCM